MPETPLHKDVSDEEGLAGIFNPIAQRRFIQIIAYSATVSLCVGYFYSATQVDLDLTRRVAFGFGLAGFLAAAILTRLTGSAQWGAAILVVVGIGITLLPAYYEGGLRSPYAVWFLVVPVLGGLLLGPRIAYLAGSAGIAAMLLLALVSEDLPQPESGQDNTAMLALNMVLAIALCTAIGSIVSRMMTRSAFELTESRNAEIEKNQALLLVNDKFKGSVNLSAEAIVMVDQGNIITVFNPAAEAMYGHSAETAIGHTMPELLIPPRLQPDHLSGFNRYAETGMANVLGIKLETFSIHADGTEFPIRLMVQEISGGEEPQFIAYIRDLTERNKLREEIAQKEKQIGLKRRLEAIGRLSGGVAHDFNNLLMAINGYAELLLLREDLPEEARAGLTEISRAGDKANSITKQLLAFSRRDSLSTENINPAAMVASLVDMVSKVLPDSIRLDLKKEGSSWFVRSEPARLEQAVLNLILNAADAMPDGGKVYLRIRDLVVDKDTAATIKDLNPGEYSCIEVNDDGVGMDAETLEHIFDPFFTTKATGEGTGLGLSTTYGIVHQSGGAIGVESLPGVGSTFTIHLPRAAEVEGYYTEPGIAKTSGWEVNETVLVVEDEQSVRNLVVRTLSNQGYSVIEANDGVRGYELALRHAAEIDLIITDVVMPKLGGAEMVRRLRISIPDLKVVFVSGHSEDELDASDISAPGTAFLYKPFNLEALSSTVRGLLEADSDPRVRV
ncbi:MAG TPA: PAS domain S-box protein [Myxococcales bacterium]|nr:PAS domain S-box protein [Myxococcales bacterium]